MLREIIKIDEEKCDGCGACVPSCHEGAIQIIEGKARLISDLFCDGLGACIGHCPTGAITIEKREAEPYNEVKVMDIMIAKPDSVIKAHLIHLFEHNEKELLNQALEYLKSKDKKIEVEFGKIESEEQNHQGCPGSKMINLNVLKSAPPKAIKEAKNDSQLEQWPVMLHLVNPNASYFKNKELVIMSTCGPIASANIHKDYLAGRAVVVACPKLDNTEPYIDKLSAIFAIGEVKKAIIVRMEVPCCGGLSQFAMIAAMRDSMNLKLEEHTLSLEGNLINNRIIYNKLEIC